MARAHSYQVFAKQAESFLQREGTLKHQQRTERIVPYPTKLYLTKVTNFSGGEEKFFPTKILSDKVLSDKVIRKLGEIHIL